MSFASAARPSSFFISRLSFGTSASISAMTAGSFDRASDGSAEPDAVLRVSSMSLLVAKGWSRAYPKRAGHWNEAPPKGAHDP